MNGIPAGKSCFLTGALRDISSRGFVARTDTLELYEHECRQDLWTVSNRERVARRAACHLSDAGAQALGQVKVVGAVGVVVLTFLLTVYLA